MPYTQVIPYSGTYDPHQKHIFYELKVRVGYTRERVTWSRCNGIGKTVTRRSPTEANIRRKVKKPSYNANKIIERHEAKVCGSRRENKEMEADNAHEMMTNKAQRSRKKQERRQPSGQITSACCTAHAQVTCDSAGSRSLGEWKNVLQEASLEINPIRQ